ncbi:response regulator transcription factor [Lachnospiraceae bacterium 62-35]
MKILIVDDEKDIVELIRRSLIMEGYETVCACCGEEAIHKVQVEYPDIILLDIMLPDMDGYEVLQRIQGFDDTIPVIFITAHDKRYSKILGLELGADDFITKPFNIKELVLKIKAIWRRMNCKRINREPPGKTLHYETMEIDPALRRIFVDGQVRELTYKEFDTIYFLASHYAQVFTREQLINEIWGFDYMGNTRAVDILIKRLRSKIEPYGTFIQTVYGVGYRFEVKKREEKE